MKLLKSTRMNIPTVYFVSDRAEIKDIPIGVPFMYGDEKREESLVRILEYEVLYQEAIKSGFPFDFRTILRESGYMDLISWGASDTVFMDISSDETAADADFELEYKTLLDQKSMLEDYARDSSAIVDVQKLKDLNVFPIWLDTIEEAVRTNIHNFSVFNPHMYNKKLDGMYGGVDMVSPAKNLIIIDISGSIPRAVSSTCLTLAKYLAETFYADLIITGSESKLYPYEEIEKLDVDKAYDCGMGNEAFQIRSLLASDDRHYKTVICFGDDDNIGGTWSSDNPDYSSDKGYSATNPPYIYAKATSDEEGKKLCTWTTDKLISFHTGNRTDNKYWGNRRIREASMTAGYARWFSPLETEHVKDWVKYLN